VALLDHVTKDAQGRGRYAIGAQHKLASIDGAAYSLEVVRPFGRGLTGVARIDVTKDRPGFVRSFAVGGSHVAELHVVSDDGGGEVLIDVRPPEPVVIDGMSPAARRVLQALRAGGPSQSTAQIQDRTANDGQGLPLKRRTVQAALADLETGGAAVGTPSVNGSQRYWSEADRADTWSEGLQG
jgi:hypothetical protein